MLATETAPPVMTNRVESVAERESLKTRNWVLLGVVAGLMLFVQAIMTFVVTNAATKMDAYADSLGRVLTAVEVMGAHNEALTRRVVELEDALKSHATDSKSREGRIGSLETRAAIFDAYMANRK